MISYVTPQPLQEAVDSLGRKSPLGIALSSEQWATLPVEIRDRAFFSAQVESERILAEAQRRIMQRVKLERDKIEDGGRVMERTRFIEEMGDLLEELGYQPDPEKKGTLQDLSSAGRLGLIWQMQLDQAHGHAAWKTGMDPDILEAFPAQELVRDMERMERREWPQLWRDAEGVFYGEPGPDYPMAPGRMIALKTDPIWTAISEFGTPWPPFAWGSGMGLRDVPRSEAVLLGLIDPEDPMIPAADPFRPNAEWSTAVQERGRQHAAAVQQPFTAGMEASAKGLPDTALRRIEATFPGRVLIDAAAGVIRWLFEKGGAA